MALKGNPSLTGSVGTADCSIILKAYSAASVGESYDHLLREEQLIAGDVFKNSEDIKLDSNDVSTILAYTKYLRNGGMKTCEEWLAAGQPNYDP